MTLSVQGKGVSLGEVGSGAGVTAIDGITGSITLVAGSNITITDNSPTAGNITIASTGGGTPGGTNGQLQYNNTGAFGGTNITYGVSGGNPAFTPGTGILSVLGTLNAAGTSAGLSFEDRNNSGIPNNFTLYASLGVASLFSNTTGMNVLSVDTAGNATIVGNSATKGEGWFQDVLDVGSSGALGWTGQAVTTINYTGIGLISQDSMGNNLKICDNTQALLATDASSLYEASLCAAGGPAGLFTNVGDTGIDTLVVYNPNSATSNCYANVSFYNDVSAPSTGVPLANMTLLCSGFPGGSAPWTGNDFLCLIGQGNSGSNLFFFTNTGGAVNFGAGGYGAANLALTVNTNQTLTVYKTVSSYNGVATAGGGLAAFRAANDLTGQTTGVVITTFTPSATGTFVISGYINIAAVTLDVIKLTITYKDQDGTSQTITPLSGLGSIGNNSFTTGEIRCNNTIITVATTLTTGTGSISYAVGASIQQNR